MLVALGLEVLLCQAEARPPRPPAPHPASVSLLGGGKLGLKDQTAQLQQPGNGERIPSPRRHAAMLLPEAVGTSVTCLI